MLNTEQPIHSPMIDPISDMKRANCQKHNTMYTYVYLHQVFIVYGHVMIKFLNQYVARNFGEKHTHLPLLRPLV